MKQHELKWGKGSSKRQTFLGIGHMLPIFFRRSSDMKWGQRQRQPGDCSRGKTKELEILLLTITAETVFLVSFWPQLEWRAGGGERKSLQKGAKTVKTKNNNKSETVLHSPQDHSKVNHNRHHTHIWHFLYRMTLKICTQNPVKVFGSERAVLRYRMSSLYGRCSIIHLSGGKNRG